MRISKEKALEIFKDYSETVERINKIKDYFVFLDIMGKEQYKSNKQNRLFHALLSCFWVSGCSSFGNYDDLRLYYKRVAGLVKRSGDVIKEGSWSDATKEQARIAIDMILRDMDFAGVIGSNQGKKYESILRGINEFYEELR